MGNCISRGNQPIGPSAIGAAQTYRPDEPGRPTAPAPAPPNLTEVQRAEVRPPPNSQGRRERARFSSTNARSTSQQANISEPAPHNLTEAQRTALSQALSSPGIRESAQLLDGQPETHGRPAQQDAQPAAFQNESASPILDHRLTDLLSKVASHLSRADRASFRLTSKALAAAGAVAQRQLRVRNAEDFQKALDAFAPGGLDGIDAWNAGLTEADAGMLAQPLPPRVKLGFNRIGNHGARALAANLTITSLHLKCNNIKYEGAMALADNPTITTLDLSGNNIKDEGAIALADNKAITSLDLSKNDIGVEGARALALNPTITSLNLRSNNIGDEGAAALVANTRITSLDLQHNNIGWRGATALAANRTITTLSFVFNNIGDDGAMALAANPTITSLDLRGNRFGPAGRQALEAVRGRFELLLL